MALAKRYNATPREFLARVDSAELTELLAADRLGILHDPAADVAALRATLVNLLGAGTRKVSAADFLPNFEPPKVQTSRDHRAIVEAHRAAMMGRKRRRNPPC